MEYTIEILSILLASSIVMIVHELPKSIMYVLTGRHCRPEDRWKIFKIYQYIDPIGLILFLTCHAGTSKPYPYRLKEKDTNLAIGLSGLLTLCVMIVASYFIYYQVVFNLLVTVGLESGGMPMLFVVKISWYLIYASIVLFIINLVPMTTSDMFLLIIAISPAKMLGLLKKDTVIKGMMIIAIVLGLVSSLALTGMNFMSEFLGFV